MATVPELFVAVFATASVVLVTAILICRSPGQPLKPPKTESLTPIDDIPADHTDNLDWNPKSIIEHHPVLRRDAALAPKDKKSLTLRINDIPADHTDNLDRNLKSILEEVPDLQGDADTMVRRSLVPHGNDSLCATISIITSLSADDLSAQLRRAGNGYPYNYTCKFEGITPLYEDKNGADVDIIAVPGLGSHALGSWKSPNSDDVWLRDFLSKDVPNIRVLLYGYDTTLPGSLSKQSIEDLGGALLEQIIAYRAGDGTSHRPIIFTGHSLGGLLIKEALVGARRRRSNANSDLSKASYGLLFFGVPNLGLRNDQLRTLVRGQPNEALIHDLLVDSDSEPSTFLKRLADQFSESCKGHYRVVTFFERTLSPTLELDQDGKWRKTGRPSLLVTEKSTTSTGLVAVAEEDNIALNTDHSGLVKYDSRSQGDYTIVRERLRRLVDEAKLEVSKRFAEHNLYQPLSETTKACLKSLAFEDMDGRQVKIDDAAEGTCKWLLNHKSLIE
ncbi:Alpha/beta hydrolase fold-1 [Fusarium oxysporum f. sp. vasinfectum]|nr:Alpha/beta hydrolase fold-1 [Fusarium oxysporum f. sp. vasinfectum]